MLVVTSTSAIRRAKQKPRQWGPLSSVQSAVRWNAERLGLAAPVDSAYPVWSGVGAGVDVVSGASLPLQGASSWTDSGDALHCGDGVNVAAYALHSNPPEPSYVSWLVGIKPGTIPSRTPFFGSKNFVTSNDGFGLRKFYSSYRFYFGGSTLSGYAAPASAPLANNTLSFLAATYDGTTIRVYDESGEIVSDSTVASGPLQYNATSEFHLGAGDTYSADPTDHDIVIAYVYGGVWSADEVARLIAQPYALLQPYTPPIWVDLGASSGGTIYDISVNDGWDVGDSAGASAIFGVSATDGIDGGDSAGSTAVFNVSAADGVTGGDSSGGVAEFVTSLTDGLVLGDTSGLSLVITVSASDGVKAGDAVSVAVSFSVSVVDGWEAGDNTGAAATLNISVTDGSELSEALSFYSGATLSVTDGFKAGDSVSVAVEWLASLVDGIVVGDTSGGTAEYVLTITDGAVIGDVLQAVAEMAVAVSDGFNTGDTASVDLGDRVTGFARFVFMVGGLELRLVVPDKLRRLVLPEDGGDLEH